MQNLTEAYFVMTFWSNLRTSPTKADDGKNYERNVQRHCGKYSHQNIKNIYFQGSKLV